MVRCCPESLLQTKGEVCVYILICIYTYLYIYMHMCVYLSLSIYIYVNAYIHTHIYIYIYTHIYMQITRCTLAGYEDGCGRLLGTDSQEQR